MDELVTLQISEGAREKLRKLAEANLRSMKAHFEWLINREYAEYEIHVRITEQGRAALKAEHDIENVSETG